MKYMPDMAECSMIRLYRLISITNHGIPVYTPDEFSAIENNVFNEYEKANVRFLAEIKDSM